MTATGATQARNASRPWLAHYPPAVPPELDDARIGTLADLIGSACSTHADRPWGIGAVFLAESLDPNVTVAVGSIRLHCAVCIGGSHVIDGLTSTVVPGIKDPIRPWVGVP